MFAKPAQPRLIAVGVLAAAAGLTAAALGVGRWKTRKSSSPLSHAAKRDGEGVIRSAGPQGMRDKTRHEWTKVDQASDESFPASDPPATY